MTKASTHRRILDLTVVIALVVILVGVAVVVERPLSTFLFALAGVVFAIGAVVVVRGRSRYLTPSEIHALEQRATTPIRAATRLRFIGIAMPVLAGVTVGVSLLVNESARPILLLQAVFFVALAVFFLIGASARARSEALAQTDISARRSHLNLGGSVGDRVPRPVDDAS